MKTNQNRTFAGRLLCLCLPVFLALPLRAELKETPLLLNKQGSYIELTEGVFQRSEAIDTVKGEIEVMFAGDVPTRSFPLNPKGLADFKSLDRTKLEAVVSVDVSIIINKECYQLVSSTGDAPIKNWEPFEAAVNKAMEQLQKLLVMASPPPPASPRVVRPRVEPSKP